MKVSIEKKDKITFEPITVTLVIESKKELEAFLSLHNASGNDMAEFANNHPVSGTIGYIDPTTCRNLLPHSDWHTLKDIYEKC